MHTELVSYSATAPGAAGAAAAAFTGDSLTIKNSRGPAQILAIWGNNQSEGFHQITFPSGHDTTRGWRTIMEAAAVQTRNVMGAAIIVQPQELLSITIAGSAVAGDVETGHMLVHYKDLPGVNSREIDWAEVMRDGEEQTTVQATITAAAGPGYTGSELINADSDLLRANRDYAVLGIETETPQGCIRIVGPDTGNVGTGCPGDNLNGQITGGFYGMLSRAYNMPLIPVINSGNKQSTSLTVGGNENAVSTIISINLVMLKPNAHR